MFGTILQGVGLGVLDLLFVAGATVVSTVFFAYVISIIGGLVNEFDDGGWLFFGSFMGILIGAVGSIWGLFHVGLAAAFIDLLALALFGVLFTGALIWGVKRFAFRS